MREREGERERVWTMHESIPKLSTSLIIFTFIPSSSEERTQTPLVLRIIDAPFPSSSLPLTQTHILGDCFSEVLSSFLPVMSWEGRQRERITVWKKGRKAQKLESEGDGERDEGW
jgi:hypothetical protein